MNKVGLLGVKKGMTQLFLEEGRSLPVTVIEVSDNVVAGLQTEEKNGYSAVLVGSDQAALKNVNQPMKGFYKSRELTPSKRLKEFRVSPSDLSAYEVGQSLSVEVFTVGDKVDVVSTSKGKGFAGAVKRWNFRTQDATHGNSLSHRAPGSIGQCQTPGRVFKGKKMAGQLGNVKTTQQNLEVVKVLVDKNLILLKGSVPGATGAEVIVNSSIKKSAA